MTLTMIIVLRIDEYYLTFKLLPVDITINQEKDPVFSHVIYHTIKTVGNSH